MELAEGEKEANRIKTLRQWRCSAVSFEWRKEGSYRQKKNVADGRWQVDWRKKNIYEGGWKRVMNWYGMQKRNVTRGDKLRISDENRRKPSSGVFCFFLSSLAWWTGHRQSRPVYRPSSAFSLAFPTIKPLITLELYRGAALSFDCIDSETLCQPYVFFLFLFVRLFLHMPVPVPWCGLTN